MKKYLMKTKLLQVGIISLIFAINTLMVINSFLNIRMTNAIIAFDLNEFLTNLIYVIITMLTVSLLSFLKGLLLSKSKKKIALMIREEYILNYIQDYDMSDKNDANQVISHLTNDVNYVINNGLTLTYTFISLLFGVILSLSGAALIHWSFIIIFPVSALVSAVTMNKFSPIIQKISQEQSEENKNFIVTLNNLFSGFSTLFSYHALGSFHKKFNGSNEMLEIKKEKYGRKLALVDSIIMCAMVIAQLGYIIVAGYLVISKILTPGSIVGLMSIAQSFYGNSQNTISTKIQINSTKPILAKILSYTNNDQKGKNIDEVMYSIKMENVTYIYSESENVIIENRTDTFEIGKKYLIQGTSGSGKTTFLKLLSGRLKGYSGEIFYDNIDIKELSQECLTNLIAYVSQDTYIFEDTIKYNITLGKEISDERYQNALQLSKLNDFVLSKSEGDQFILSTTGKNLSGGQRQRIALARAIYYGKQIFMIDEGLQGLDAKTADELESQILELPDVTLFMISHRTNEEMNQRYDKIIKIL